ncbi:MAG: glycosyltransferase family 4 protein [Deltaproteobacteria bacterium]|nr:glycosyltransferase family 4 protein [Deltaproteobacteria bacterium]
MRLRFFNTYEPVAPLYRDLLPVLADRGHSVEVVIAGRAYRPGEVREDREGLSFRTVPTPALGQGRLAKAMTHAGYVLGASTLSGLGRGVDLNVFMTQPPLFGAWGGALGLTRGQPYACIVMDLYPHVATEAGVLPRRSVLTRGLEALAGRTLRGARAVIVIGRCMADRMAAMGVDPGRVHVIHNWSDTEAVRPVAVGDNGLRASLGLQDEFVVMYSGNLGVAHSFEEVLGAAERIGPEAGVSFVFAGEGARKREVEAAARRLPHLRVMGYQPIERLSESLSMGDVHYISLRPGFEGLVVPSKAYGVFAAGRPVLYQGAASGEIARVVEEEEVGVVLAPGDTEGLVEAILGQRDDSAGRAAAGQRARELAVGTYSREAALERYLEVLVGGAS